ncbi:hypothetical protein MKW92_015225 [Papaver armeniacum]|nr:hypothetical protein MKW92_015225 [Papaver armeniacum]
MVMSDIKLDEIKVESPSSITKPSVKKLTLVPLIFLIFFEASGIPEALITAELATAYPGNGGYVIWASEAFGPFWGSMMGSLKFLSGSINSAAYPVLIKDYIKNSSPTLTIFLHKKVPKNITLCITTIALSVLNYLGLSVVGWVSVAIGVVSMLPFLIMGLIAIPKMKWHRLVSLGTNGRNFQKNDWTTFLNTLFWNLNFWDNASTLAGEVENPQKTFPKALFFAGLIACFGYLIPLLAITGALPLDQDKWDNGYLDIAAGKIGGSWLKLWVAIGSALSGVGLFEAQLSSSSFQAEGMANLRFLPGFFAWRSKKFNTPWVGILLSGAISLGLTFIIKMFPVLCIMCLIPATFVVVVMRFSNLFLSTLALGLTFIAICNYFFMAQKSNVH